MESHPTPRWTLRAGLILSGTKNQTNNMPTYKILGTDGKEYGPINADQLRQWITQKRVIPSTSIQADGGDWQPLSSFPEFADAPAGGPPTLPTPPPTGPVKTSGLAIASLACGVFGCLCLPALAGVILGIMALLKINKSQGKLGGRGLAIAGLCVSGVMLLLSPGMMLPGLAKAKAKAARINCVSQLKAIGMGARLYSNDNKDVLPPDFLSMSNELNTPKILICPSDTQHTKVSTWAEFDPLKNLSYEYLQPGIAESNAENQVIFRCPIHENVCLGDGSVQMRPKTYPDGRPGRGR